MSGGGKRDFGKDVGDHVVSRTPSDGDGPGFDEATSEVVLGVDVLGFVGGEGNTTCVVFESLGRIDEWTTNSGKELAEE